jgi:hypothetical protein
MIPMISRNTFLFFCLSFFHTLRVEEEVWIRRRRRRRKCSSVK